MKREAAILGCGWLGLPLAEKLLEQGYRVKGSTTRVEKLPDLTRRGVDAFRIRVGEVLEGEQIEAFFCADTLIVNIPPGGRRNPAVVTEHPRQVEAIVAAALRGGVKRLLFISSTGVYGQTDGLLTEADPPEPRTASGRALAAVEQWLQGQAGMDVTILRFAGLVGGDRQAGRFLAGRTGVPNGHAPVNLIHRDDCIRIIAEILRQEKWGKVYNACADEHPSRRAFYVQQAEKEGLTPPVFADDNGAEKGKIISNEKLKRELGYRFLHPDPMQF